MNNYAATIWSLVSIFLLTVFFSWFYWDYRVDQFRQKVFSLRDRLFDDAAAGRIPFNHKAYGIMRLTLNGSIRFAHRLNLLYFLIVAFRTRDRSQTSAHYDKMFSIAISNLTYEQRSIFLKYRDELDELLIEHIVFSSPMVLTLFLIPFLTFYLVKKLTKWLFKKLANPLGEVRDVAYVVGKEEGCLGSAF
jgi:hypothetical protein